MSAGTTFFISSCAVLTLAIVNLNVSPTFNVKISEWHYSNCGILSDQLDEYKKSNNPIQEEIEKKERDIRTCKIKKLMYTLEQGTFILNLGIGLFGVLFGLFGLEKEFKPKVGIVGLIFGILGFILTLGYTFFNGIVYTNYYDNSNLYKIEEDASFAVSESDNSYKCLYYNKENDTDPLIAKFSDLMKSQYNYNLDLIKSFVSKDKQGCNAYSFNKYPYYNIKPQLCSKTGIIEGSPQYEDSDGNLKRCEKLYYYYSEYYKDYKNYDVSVRFLTCLIISIFSAICHVGLFIGAIKLFKESE